MKTDGELVKACRAGDAAAWEALVHRFERLVFTIPRRAGLDEDLAADIFQEVFALLVQKLDTIHEPDRIRAWLVTTAKLLSWKVVRNRRRSVSVNIDDDTDAFPELHDEQTLADQNLIDLEAQHQVRTAMTALDERCKRLLTMLFYTTEPPSYAEIAQELGTSEGSIGPTRARCLQKLMRLLG